MNLSRISLSLAALLVPFFSISAQVAVERATQEEPAATTEASASPESAEQTPSDSETSKKQRPVKKERTVSDLQDSMTAEEFKAAGLDKLTPEELKNLNARLQGEKKKVEIKATEKATAETTKKMAARAKPKIDRVESRVDGTLEHLNGHSIIKLEDGTVWKQAVPDDHYRAQVTDHPNATVYRTGFGWKMRISGLPEFYVNPVH